MDDLRALLQACEGFDWDEHNAEKNRLKHGVEPAECEQVFSNRLMVARDPIHSTDEDRFFVLGRTDAARRLFIAFSIRESLVRVISARDMSRKEREVYSRHETT